MILYYNIFTYYVYKQQIYLRIGMLRMKNSISNFLNMIVKLDESLAIEKLNMLYIIGCGKHEHKI